MTNDEVSEEIANDLPAAGQSADGHGPIAKLLLASAEYVLEIVIHGVILAIFGIITYAISALYDLFNFHGETLWITLAVRGALHIASVWGVLLYIWRTHGQFRRKRHKTHFNFRPDTQEPTHSSYTATR